MADLGALRELQNDQRPPRRLDKVYGKKNRIKAPTRAMHFDLFGGGDENEIVKKMDGLTVEDDTEETKKPAKDIPPPPEEQLAKESSQVDQEKTTVQRRRRTEEPKKPAKDISSPSEEQPAKESSQQIQGKPTVQRPRRGRRLRRRKPIPSSTMSGSTQEEDTMLKSLLGLAKQKNIRDFMEYGEDLEQQYNCTKLGEGGYGEVFEIYSKDPDSATDIERDQGIVLKVVAFGSEQYSIDSDTAKLPAVLREAQLSLALDPLHGFVRCRGISIVCGKYPDILLDAFRTYVDEHPNDTENDDPDSYPEDQTFMIIEMNHAGASIAKIRTPSAFQAFDIFWETVIILANAEEKLEFEHRDLHIGNICYKPQVRDGPTDLAVETITNPAYDPEVTLGLSKLQVTIIDYSLARAKIGEEVLFDPIEHWEEDRLNTGDEIDLAQFATYRQVRDWAKVQAAALANVEGTEVDKYARFLPKTNVVWLSYLVRALLLRRGLAKPATLGNVSESARRLQSDLWGRLEAVADVVGKAPTLIPGSAADLLATALSSGWLRKADVEAFRARMEEL
ncbi:hypothetical protein LTR10_013158 [Elasticomyces elasticus]|uniref:Protein kinase domain-containing protein n=1 Tax=Exophiala sideris TaxID=1016849 RepID=A0ABR0JBE3_9EURO|nr:hypothetical protein LTR10_013158 [Elasticomyces elasticus]KAK5030533.1 hypothetical protein LTS07_005317 [Exophiala sideris]KAK5038587.1 hypothetical protein LTR13_004334 [Exophiala sideris]KAK5060468.1 hypothetical protein LTR69_005785 [Exophiala sideris]KAK5183380.1 hypothetical protein LTR44_004381 [Eurotiomycetes sp. CCFEE 6388]